MILVWLLLLAFSWFITVAVVSFVGYCFRRYVSVLTATGIWVIILVLKFIF